ncbi:Zn-ribbon domain-containing OB-fold protein [Nocardia salmonicida]
MYSPEPANCAKACEVTAQHGQDTLMIRRCTHCDKLYAPLATECSSCTSGSFEWLPSSGAGSIVSWRVVDRAATGLHGEAPLTIAIVELDEGPWVYTSIEGAVPALRGQPVRVQFQPCPPDDRFPVFAVSAQNRSGKSAKYSRKLT